MNKIVAFFFTLLTTLLLLWYVNNSVTILFEAPTAATLWVITLAIGFRDLPPKARKAYFLMQLFAFLIATHSYLVSYPDNLKKATHSFMFLQAIISPAFAFCILAARKQKFELWIPFLAISVSLIHTFSATLTAFSINPNASRMVTSGLDKEDALYLQTKLFYSMGVANLCLSLAYLYLFATYLQLASKSTNALRRILLIILSALCGYYIFNAQYGTLFGLAIISLFIVGWNHIAKPYRIVYIILAIIIYSYIPDILHAIAATMNGSMFSVRLNDLANIVENGDTSGVATQGRLSVYLPALEAFSNSPIWGNTIVQYGRTLIFQDSHSIFLSSMVESGLLGLFFITSLFFHCIKSICSALGKYAILYSPTIILFIVICFTDSSLYALAQYSIVLFYVPLTILIFRKYEATD